MITSAAITVQLIEGDSASESGRARQREAEQQLRAEFRADAMDAFPLVVVPPDLAQASMTLLQSWGVGSIRANTVALNWLEHHGEGASASESLEYDWAECPNITLASDLR